MTRRLIIALFISLVIVIFAVQNSGQVTVNLFFWSFPVSLAVVLTICIFCGALVGSFIAVYSVKRKADRNIPK